MTTIAISLIISALVYLTYTILSVITYTVLYDKIKLTVPKSISDTFYIMPTWSFIAFLGICMCCIMVMSFGFMQESTGELSDLSWTNIGALFLLGVPAFANMRAKKVKTLHYISAVVGFTLIALGFGLDYGLWYWTITMAINAGIVFLLTKKHNPIWWTEHALIINMIYGYVLVIDKLLTIQI